MKDIAKTIVFDEKKFIPNEDNGVTLVEKLSCERVKAIDDYIIKQLYEAYKDTEISKLFIIDETEFARYLKATLPQYLKGKNEKDEKKLKAFEIIDKLGKIEDIEEEYGIEITTISKLLKQGFVYIREGASIEKNQGFVIDNTGLWSQVKLDPKEYGKNWALTKEELELS